MTPSQSGASSIRATSVFVWLSDMESNHDLPLIRRAYRPLYYPTIVYGAISWYRSKSSGFSSQCFYLVSLDCKFGAS